MLETMSRQKLAYSRPQAHKKSYAPSLGSPLQLELHFGGSSLAMWLVAQTRAAVHAFAAVLNSTLASLYINWSNQSGRVQCLPYLERLADCSILDPRLLLQAAHIYMDLQFD